MNTQDFSSLTLTAIQAALKAGEILRKGFGSLFEITMKPGRQNFVTEFDKASEACIISMIKETFPLHSILAEESGFLNHSEDAILWIIDPLDGTTNFAHHIPLFTISIAAFQGEHGLCGVIFQPMTHELFVAEKGYGAYLNGTRLKVSQTNRLEESVIVANLPFDMQTAPILSVEHLVNLNQKGVIVRNFGSAALALAYIAAGKIDAFFMNNLFPWDLAAGQVLIEEAGGLITCHKSPSLYGPSNLFASNQALHHLLRSF